MSHNRAGDPLANVATLMTRFLPVARRIQLMFSYRVETNMAGGQVEFSLPAGWTIIKATGRYRTDEKVDADPPTGDPYDRYRATLWLKSMKTMALLLPPLPLLLLMLAQVSFRYK